MTQTNSVQGSKTTANSVSGSQTLALDAMQALTSAIEAAVNKPKEKRKNVDTTLVREGQKMILPDGMSCDAAIEVLQRKKKEQETLVNIHEEVEVFPLDGAYALRQVLTEMFGWADAVPREVETFFGKKKIAPHIVTLEIGFGEYTQVIWGDFAVPGVNGPLRCGATEKHGRPIFVISGEVMMQDKPAVQRLADKVRAYAKVKSIYRGKAIKLRTNEDGDLNYEDAPSFLDLSNVNPRELVFPEAVAEQVQTNLMTPIQKTAMCRAHKIPLKRGILFEGKYGTGKTLTAYVTAKTCEENGWTFIYLDRVGGLRQAIMFANQYAPAVIFAEDIDRVTTGERNASIDDILNQIDGIEAKSAEIITILTTNHVDKIEKAMMRPGRLDAVISVSPPDAKAAEKLMRIYARGLLTAGEDLTEAGRELDGQIPAVIREVVERSKLSAITRADGSEPMALRGEDLVQAAQTMKRQLELMQPKTPKATTTEEDLGIALSQIVAARVNGNVEKPLAKLQDDTTILRKRFGC